MKHYDVIIVGAGPAGVSCALYTTNGGLRTAVFYTEKTALAKAEHITNFYGKSTSGAELYAAGIAQAAQNGAQMHAEEVLSLSYDLSGEFVAKTAQGTYSAPVAVLACGTGRLAPSLEGLRRLEGAGVSYCATCDAFFARGKAVAVIGNADYALEEASVLAPLAKSVTIFTDGLPSPQTDYPVVTQKLARVEGDTVVTGLTATDGTTYSVDRVFVALGTAGAAALALKLGAQIEGNSIVADETGATSIPNLYACGDCTGGLLQIAKAVHEGAITGLAIVKAHNAKKS